MFVKPLWLYLRTISLIPTCHILITKMRLHAVTAWLTAALAYAGAARPNFVFILSGEFALFQMRRAYWLMRTIR